MAALSIESIFGNIDNRSPNTVRERFKDGLDRLASVQLGFHTYIGCFRHLHSQVMPLVSLMAKGTVFSHIQLPGLTKSFHDAVNVSDFLEFVGDANYFIGGKGEFLKDVKNTRIFSILAHICGATADFTNSLELVRDWGGSQLEFLGKFGKSIAGITVFGRTPLAFAAGITVSGLCSATLCALFAFSAIDSYRRIGHEEGKIDSHTENDPQKVEKHKEKREKSKRAFYTYVAKCALYTSILGLQVTNVFVVGALGSVAFATAFSLTTYKYRV